MMMSFRCFPILFYRFAYLAKGPWKGLRLMLDSELRISRSRVESWFIQLWSVPVYRVLRGVEWCRVGGRGGARCVRWWDSSR